MGSEKYDSLPQELRKQLRPGKAREGTELRSIDVIRAMEQPFTLDEFLVEFWEKTGLIKTRQQAQSIMTSNTHIGKLKKVGVLTWHVVDEK